MPKKDKALKKASAAPKASFDLSNDFRQMFDEFAHTMEAWPFYRRAMDWPPVRRMEKAAGMMVPDIDVSEDASEMRVTVELPGMEEKDIDVELSGDRLTIRGEKREESASKEKTYQLSERRYGAFLRTLRLPDTVEGEKISAEMKNGVLSVVMPKTALAKEKQRKISVEKR